MKVNARMSDALHEHSMTCDVGRIGFRADGNPRRRGGRPDKRTESDTMEVLLNALRGGSTYKTAGDLAGISERTIYRWICEGEGAAEGSLARQFCHALKAALAEAEHRCVVTVQKGGPEWKAAAWILERRNPTVWGKRRTVRDLNSER